MIVRRIEILEPQLANKIAAGEVVERPASVVKELVENSLDAGAAAVTVEIREGGAEYIRVTDNGCGIEEEDVKIAFLRHATSKLRSAEGLDGIETLGFRGEALASIAAVSHVVMRTRTESAEFGTLIRLDGGAVSELLPCGCPPGTTIEVRELFYNVPARLKFLKSPRGEAAAVGDYMSRLILGSTEVSFKFISAGKTVYHSAGDGSLENALVCVYGPDIAEHIMPVRYDDGYILIEGYCGDEFVSRANRSHQSIFVNGRYIRSQQLGFAAQRAYLTRLMQGRFPFLALNITISPREVDVNVHPNKLTVRFRDEERVASAVMLAVREALEGGVKGPAPRQSEPASGRAEPAPIIFDSFRSEGTPRVDPADIPAPAP
ncbi:MAG: DNA mismatch repair endonuclease MutL, partial [Clostridia bacterium]|nr:DNA mismatch repair endonuclease MutL [Clostridia bacterium]